MRKMKIILTVVVLLSLALSATALSAPITITASATPKTGGTITPSGRLKIFPGADQTFEIRPVTGYEIKDVVVDRVSQGNINMYTFTNVTSNHSIQVKFGAIPFTTTISGQEGVKITPYGTKIYKVGKKQSFTVSPPKGVTDVPLVIVDGKKVENYDPATNPYGLKKVGANYKFTLLVTGNHSILATLPKPPVLSSEVKLLEEAGTLSWFSDDLTVFHFSQTSLQPGDIIAGGLSIVPGGSGLLRRVETVSGSSPVIVTTTETSLEEALVEGQIQISKKLAPADITSIATLEGITLQPHPLGAEGFYFKIDNVVIYDKDGNQNTTLDQVRMDGSITINPGFDLFYDKDSGDLSFSVIVEKSIEITFHAGIHEELKKKVPVPGIYLVLSPIPIVPPFIYGIPIITVWVGLDGEVNAGIVAKITPWSKLQAGVCRYNGIWSGIGSREASIGLDFNSLRLELQGKAKAYVAPQLDLWVSGIPGPWASIRAYLEFDIDPFDNPLWELYGGIEADVGVLLRIFSKTLVDYEKQGVVGWRKLLADSNTVHHQIDYSGHWRGAWRGWWDSGSLDVTMIQAEYGSTISGHVTPTNSGMPANQFFLGEVEGNTIKWVTANFGRCSMTATGDAVSPTHLSGSYEVICAGELWDIGTWSLDKQP